jgi:hypothetical protein
MFEDMVRQIYDNETESIKLHNPSATENEKNIKRQIKKGSWGNIVHYSFCGPDIDDMVNLGKRIIFEKNLSRARIYKTHSKDGADAVLFVYDSVPRHVFTIGGYARLKSNVKFIGWEYESLTPEHSRLKK